MCRYKGQPRATVIKYKISDELPSIVDPAAVENELPPMSFKNVQNGTLDKKFSKNKDANNAEGIKKFDSNFKPMSKTEVCRQC